MRRFILYSLIFLLGLGVYFSIRTFREPATARLVFMGDIMLGRSVGRAHAGGDWESALGPLPPVLQSADLALANLESPLTGAPLRRQTYDLRAAPESAQLLAFSGLDLLSLANNHSLDSGDQGLKDTLAALADYGLTPVGPEPAPVIRRVGRLRLAFLAFEDVTAPLDAATVAQAVTKARTGNDLVLVSIHWGGEYRPAPNARQRFLAQALADAGADLIWGHHPHVLQSVEWVQGNGRPRQTLVAYSLGNALFDQVAPPDSRWGALLQVTLSTKGVIAVQSLPFEIDPFHGVVLPADETIREKVFERLGSVAQPLNAQAEFKVERASRSK